MSDGVEKFLSKESDDDFENQYGKEIDGFLDELAENDRINSEIESELATFNEVAEALPVDEIQKGILRGIVKQNAMKHALFNGTKRDDEKHSKYARAEAAIRFLASECELSDEAVWFSPPNQSESGAVISIDLPDLFSVGSGARVYLAEAIRCADETKFALVKELGKEYLPSEEIRISFIFNDIWSEE